MPEHRWTIAYVRARVSAARGSFSSAGSTPLGAESWLDALASGRTAQCVHSHTVHDLPLGHALGVHC